MDTPREVELKQLIADCGAVRHGHFRLASGRHSDIYIEKFRILERPPVLEKMCDAIVGRFRGMEPDVVVGPSTGGIIVAYEVARQLDAGIGALYMETDTENRRVLKRNAHLAEGARALIVDDVLTTGISLQEVLSLVRDLSAQPIGVGVLIDRSEFDLDFGCDLFAACRFEAVTYPEDDLPGWLAAIPLETPGTRASHKL